MCLQQDWLWTNMEGNEINTFTRYFKWLLEIFNELLMFTGSSRLKLDNMKLYTILQDVDVTPWLLY